MDAQWRSISRVGLSIGDPLEAAGIWFMIGLNNPPSLSSPPPPPPRRRRRRRPSYSIILHCSWLSSFILLITMVGCQPRNEIHVPSIVRLYIRVYKYESRVNMRVPMVSVVPASRKRSELDQVLLHSACWCERDHIHSHQRFFTCEKGRGCHWIDSKNTLPMNHRWSGLHQALARPDWFSPPVFTNWPDTLDFMDVNSGLIVP